MRESYRLAMRQNRGDPWDISMGDEEVPACSL